MLEDSYLKLPYDLSGSMSKNRFRNEMLWGLEKMFELYKTNQDFFMVFDYVCDIEAHLDGKIEFFQIKTNNAAKPYSITKIAKPDKSGKSILGKLYAIKTADDSEDGIVSKGVENTIRNICRIGAEGMNGTDEEIIKIMTHCD